MQERIHACNAIMIFGVHEWSFKSFSLFKSWVQNRVSTGGRRWLFSLYTFSFSRLSHSLSVWWVMRRYLFFWIYCFLGRNVSLAIKIGEVLCLQHFHNKLWSLKLDRFIYLFIYLFLLFLKSKYKLVNNNNNLKN